MLHPFMPFITEELWQHIYERKDGESIMRQCLNIAMPTEADNNLITDIENVKAVVSGVRTVRNQKNIAPKEKLELQVISENPFESYNCIISKMANLDTIKVVNDKSAGNAEFMVGTTEFAVPLGDMIDIDAEIAKQKSQLEHLEKFLAGVKAKLSNAKFIDHAPESVIALERKKRSDSEEKIAAIKESIEALSKK
jgi:valyl-tRNA synthetase